MPAAKIRSRFVNFGRYQALGVLAVVVVAIAGGLTASRPVVAAASSTQPGGLDLILYRKIAGHVHAGESYYDAAARELPAGGYLTGSIFNWRTPTYAWLFGKLPDPAWAHALLVLAVLATMLLAYGMLQREGAPWMATPAVVLLVGAFEWCIDGDAFLATEVWAGVLIALSLCLFERGRWVPAVLAGLLALFFRELVLPYCLVCLVLACRQRRSKEVALWAGGLALYGVFLTWHAVEVAHRINDLKAAGLISASDHAGAAGWIQFGGMPMMLATAKMNFFLIKAPLWVTAIYLPLALLGLAAWPGATGFRAGLTAAAYVAAFAVVGKPFNDYWGILYAPLLVLGIVWAPVALRDLVRVVTREIRNTKSETQNPKSETNPKYETQMTKTSP